MSPGSSLDMGLMYYVKGALSGGICCGITHGAVCPLDVVKTRIQLQPEVYNKGLVGGMRQVVAAEGVGALATGLGPTVFGYFIQGWFKFGGVELFKIQFVRALGEQSAWDNRMNIYLASSAMAEFIADIFLCPLEATRIKLVANPSFASSMPSAMALIAKEEGALKGFYSGFGPILFKQVQAHANISRPHNVRQEAHDSQRCKPTQSHILRSSRFRTRWPSLPCKVSLPRRCTHPWAPRLPGCPRRVTSVFRSARASLLACALPSSHTLPTPCSQKSTRRVRILETSRT